LNPRLPPCEGFLIEEIDWNGFKRFLNSSCCEKTVGDRLRYAKKYGTVLLSRDFSVLNSFSDSKRGHILKALSLLSKFLGWHSVFQGLVKAYGLKWRNSTSEELILARIQNTRKYGNVSKWIRDVKERLPQLVEFMDFVAISGLRFNEAVNSYNLIIELARKGELGKYYDYKNHVITHYTFKELFIRRTKKAFISYVPLHLVLKIGKKEKLSTFQIYNLIRRNTKLKSRFGDVRENYATFMTKFLNPAEIDFLQGRVSASVFMRNYFNPALIQDLGKRTFKGINGLQAKIN
jgi:intergrase/recombinase